MSEIINQIINGGIVAVKTEDDFLNEVKEVEFNTSYIPVDLLILSGKEIQMSLILRKTKKAVFP